jgi:hypothetical protein
LTFPLFFAILAGFNATGQAQPANNPFRPDFSNWFGPVLGLPARPPVAAEITGSFQHSDIRESSGLAASRVNPGVFWTVNDSGGEAAVYAVDIRGRNLGVFRLNGATNRDWESISLAPCKRSANSAGERTYRGVRWCFFIADVGDNRQVRSNVQIYQAPEPELQSEAPSGSDGTLGWKLITITYEDKPHDVEATYISADGAVHLITKGRDGEVIRYVAQLDDKSSVYVARRAQLLPILPDPLTGQLVTDAAISPDFRYVAVRTYTHLYLFDADPSSGDLIPNERASICALQSLAEPQGEAVTWRTSSGELVLSSEGLRGQISTVTCQKD